MASLAQDTIIGQEGHGRAGQRKAAKAPLSTHPAFPFIVGLWFAALLGIGSLVVPVPVIERLVEMTGLSAIVPQTAPPLGFTARALIALACTVGGGLVGLLIARKVGNAHRAQASRKDRGTLAARRPISAHDELGEDGFDGAPRGRRSLAIVEEEGPSEVFELAPLPGKALPLSALDLAEVEALELADAEMIAAGPEAIAQEEPEAAQVLAAEAPVPGFTTLSEVAGDAQFSLAERQHFKLDAFGQAVGGAPIQPRQQFMPEPAPAEDPAEDEEDVMVQEPQPEPDLHFSPPSLARPFAAPDADAAAQTEVQPQTQPDFGPDLTEEAEMDEFAEPAGLEPVAAAPAAPAADWLDGEPEDLALVQLAQRLGSSIARRREMRAAAAAAAARAAVIPVAAPVAQPAAVPPAMPAVLAEEFDAAEAAQAMAAYFGAPPASQDAAPSEPAVDDEPAGVVAPLVAPGPMIDMPAAARQVFRPVEQAPAPQPAPLANLAHIDLGEDDEDEDDHAASLAASFSLPLARAAAAPAQDQEPALAADDADAEEVTLAPAPFQSPLANPFQHKAQQFVRIEDEPQPEDGTIEPAVVFPGEAREEAMAATPRATAEENERALREALMGLQRMSGAA